MTIINKLNTVLYVNDSHYKMDPDSIFEFSENIFDTFSLHSEIGSAIVETEYGKRYIKYFGKIVVRETTELDENGMTKIVVF